MFKISYYQSSNFRFQCYFVGRCITFVAEWLHNCTNLLLGQQFWQSTFSETNDPPNKSSSPSSPPHLCQPQKAIFMASWTKECTCEQQQNTRFPSRVDKRGIFQNTLGVPMGSSGFGGRSLGETGWDGAWALTFSLVCFLGGVFWLYSWVEPPSSWFFWVCL